MSQRVSRYPDHEFLAGLHVVKDSSQDWAGFLGEQLSGGNPGFNVTRLAEFQHLSGDARHFARDKEYGFRPHVAKFLNDQIIYRDFRDFEPEDRTGGDSGGAEAGATFREQGGPAVGGGAGPGVGDDGGGGGAQVKTSEAWGGGSDDIGFEVGLIADTSNPMKTNPDFNPSHYNGENKSTLIHSMQGVNDEDKDRDFPRRYFGRTHDLTSVRETQDVKLERVDFKDAGGLPAGAVFIDPIEEVGQALRGVGVAQEGGAPAIALGILIDPIAGGGGKSASSFFDKKAEIVDYDEPFWKAAINVTAIEQPFKKLLDRRNEENNGPGKHGFDAHDYSTAVETSQITVAAGSLFQGGWLVDLFLDAASMLHDIIGVGKGDPYTRYKARDGKEVSTTYIRHDAIFSHTPTVLGRIHFLVSGDALEMDPDCGIKVWGDIELDVAKKGVDTKMAPHETGQWRPTYLVPIIKKPKGGERPPVKTPSGLENPNGDTPSVPARKPVETGDNTAFWEWPGASGSSASPITGLGFDFPLDCFLPCDLPLIQCFLKFSMKFKFDLDFTSSGDTLVLSANVNTNPGDVSGTPTQGAFLASFTGDFVNVEAGDECNFSLNIAISNPDDLKNGCIHIEIFRGGRIGPEGDPDNFEGKMFTKVCCEGLEPKKGTPTLGIELECPEPVA